MYKAHVVRYIFTTYNADIQALSTHYSLLVYVGCKRLLQGFLYGVGKNLIFWLVCLQGPNVLHDSWTKSFELSKSGIWLFGLIEPSIVAYTSFVPLGTVHCLPTNTYCSQYMVLFS